jgi:THAP4-like, heme-binding beta-barrel domain
VNDRIGPLALLSGDWSGSGRGIYPTIPTFEYHEQISFADGGVKPFLAYSQRTRAADDGRPLHVETGYLRWTGAGPELVIAQPTGVAEVYVGTVTSSTDRALDLRFEAVSISRTPSAKLVTSVERLLRVDGDELAYELHMGSVGEAHQLHLSAVLHRQQS